MPGNAALMIPKTSDGRVLFAIPWHDHLLLGTTDTPVLETSLEPKPLEEEITFVLDTAAAYLSRKPTRADVLCMYAGLRPLAAPSREGQATKEVSRSHKVLVSPSGLVSIIGGKWTTYRKMAEDVVDACIGERGLPAAACRTRELPIHGNPTDAVTNEPLQHYGTEATAIRALTHSDPALGQRLHTDHPHTLAEVVHAVRHEMACTVEDVLARRVRLLFVDARAAMGSAEKVARIMAKEAGHDEAWVHAQVSAFRDLAKGYLPSTQTLT
jgi:glycerol-3-phosphate dehydrogenase